MTAWNEVGQSDRSESGIIKTSSGTLKDEFSGLEPSSIAGLTAGVAALLVIAILAIFLFRRKLTKRKKRDRYATPRRSKSTIIPLMQ